MRAGRRLFGTWKDAVAAVGFPYEDLTGRAIWTRARILREIFAVGRARSAGSARTPALLREAAKRQYGSWRAAVEATGLNYQAFIQGHRTWDARRVLSAIRALARARSLGRRKLAPKPVALYRAACREFGSWKVAVHRAGLDYETFTGKTHWTRKRVVAEIRRLAKRRRREPTGPVPVLYEAAKRHFGSWRRAVRAAGLDPLALTRLRWVGEAGMRS